MRFIPGRIAIAALLALAPASLRADGLRPPPAAADSTITAEESRRHVASLASDAMRGRQAPSPELDSAARYIAAELGRSGIEPVGGSYFHDFSLRRDDLDSGNALTIDQRRFALKEDFVPYDHTGEGEASGRVVFAGYGVSVPDSGYDDYAGLDVRGKVVLVVSGEPRRFHRGSILRTSSFATSRQKMLAAARHGAVAILVLPNPNASRLLRPTGFPWPALYPDLATSVSRLRVHLPDTGVVIPSVSVGGSVARTLFGSIDPVLRLLDAIDSTGEPRSRVLDAHVGVTTRIRRTLVPARNVMGMLRGRERPDEFVVLGAHYDHVGSRPGTALEDTIFNGADDNASGTAALMMTARALASLAPEDRPLRSMLFVAFSAEELGLYGSRAFVATSPIDPRQMIAMLNLDMVGRNAIDSISVGGMRRSKDLAAALADANRAEPFVIVDDIEDDFYRSDQAPFARAGVPVLFFHSGEHSDYHREGDNPDRLDNDKVAKVARLVLRTAWTIAETPSRPDFLGVDPNDPKAAYIFDR